MANDGIVATAGILEGFAGAGASSTTLITAATTATIAGMLSVGGAEWAEAAAERDAQIRAIEEEAAELASQPEVEHAELVAHYESKGLTPGLAYAVADELMAHNALDAQLESEHGIREMLTRADTWRAGVGGALAYLLGASIPLTVTILVPVAVEGSLIFAAVVLSLVLTSIVSSRTGRQSFTHTLWRSLAVGITTIAISYVVGRVVF